MDVCSFNFPHRNEKQNTNLLKLGVELLYLRPIVTIDFNAKKKGKEVKISFKNRKIELKF
jgi:hypothetical protein